MYELLIRDYPVEAAVPMISSPAFREEHLESPHRHPEKIYPAALLTITASRDTIVPPEAARKFHDSLLPMYAEKPERLKEVRFSKSDHIMIPEDWEESRRLAGEWFVKFL